MYTYTLLIVQKCSFVIMNMVFGLALCNNKHQSRISTKKLIKLCISHRHKPILGEWQMAEANSKILNNLSGFAICHDTYIPIPLLINYVDKL